jgi:hypothetical protein
LSERENKVEGDGERRWRVRESEIEGDDERTGEMFQGSRSSFPPQCTSHCLGPGS